MTFPRRLVFLTALIVATLTLWACGSKKEEPALTIISPQGGETLGTEDMVIKGVVQGGDHLRRNMSFASDDKIQPDSSGNGEFEATRGLPLGQPFHSSRAMTVKGSPSI